MSCRITKVLAPNGRESILFQNLHLISRDTNEASRLYIQSKGMGIGDMRVDVNGEPLIDEIIERLQGIDAITKRDFTANRPDLSVGENSLSPEIDALVKHLNKQIYEAGRKVDAYPDNQDLRHYFEGSLEKLEADKLKILDYQSSAAILEVAVRQLKFAKKVGEKRFLTDQELKHAQDISDSWSFDVLRNFLTPEQIDADGQLNQVFQEIGGQADAISNQLVNVTNERIVARLKARREELGRFGLDPINVTQIKDIGVTSAWFLDLSHAAPEIASELAGTLKRAQRNQGGRLGEITSKLAKLREGVDVEKLLQKDEKGKDTFSLVNQYSSKYYHYTNTISRELAASVFKSNGLPIADRNRARRFAFSKYYQARRNVETVVDVRFFIDELKGVKGKRQHQTEAEHRKFLVDQYGKERTDQLIEDAISHWHNYSKQRDSARERYAAEALVELETRTSEAIKKFVNEKLEMWEKVNSPVNYLNDFRSVYESTYLNDNGWKYVVRLPIAKDANGDATGYFDAKYDEILADPKLKALYDEVVNIMDEMKAYLPTDVSNRLSNNFLAAIQRSLVEKYRDEGWTSIHEHLIGAAWDSVTSDKVVELNNTVIGIEDDTSQHAPIRYVSDANIDPENRSRDIIRLVEMFSAMALHYKSMTDVQDGVLLSQRVIEEAEAIKTSGPFSMVDKVGTLLTSTNGVVNLRASAKATILAAIQGKKRAENEWESSIVRYSFNPVKNAEMKREARRIKRKRDVLESQLEEGIIPADKYESEIKELEERFKALGGRNLVWSGLFNGVLGYAQLKGMGYNLTAGMTNVAWGMLSNTIHGAAEVDFNNKEIRQAIWFMMKSRTKVDSLAARLILKYSVLFEITEVAYGKTQERQHTRFLSHLRPYEVQRRTEFLIQGASMIAQMMHTKIMRDDGTEGNLLDAYNKDGSWKAEYSNIAEEWDSLALRGDTRNKFTDFRDKVIQVNKMLHGNYDPNSSTRIKKYALGRALMMFRSWIPEGFAWRFQEQRWDEQLGRDVKGRYITYKDILTEHGVAALPKAMVMSFMGKKDITFDGEVLSELDMQNLRSNIMELKILLALIVTGILIRMSLADDDDDDDFSHWAGRTLLNQVYRIEQDLTFYVSPDGIWQVGKNVMPLMSTVEGTAKLINDVGLYLADPDARGADQYEKIARNLVLVGQMARMYDPSTRVVYD